MTGQDLFLGKELQNARLRLLSPISEEGSLFGSPSPRGRNMILLTSRVPSTPYSLPNSARMPPISSNNQQQQGRIIPAVPVLYTSPELQSLVSQYLGHNSYGRYNLTQTQHGSRMYCKCCEPINEINRSKKRKLRGEIEEPLVEEIPSGSRELVPFTTQYARTNTELINGARPGEYPTYFTEGYFPASLRQYDGWDERTAPGSASLTFGYSPRRLDHRYSSHDYDMSLGGESEVDRYIKENLIEAASRYDSSMAKLQDTVDSFKGYRKEHKVSFE